MARRGVLAPFQKRFDARLRKLGFERDEGGPGLRWRKTLSASSDLIVNIYPASYGLNEIHVELTRRWSDPQPGADPPQRVETLFLSDVSGIGHRGYEYSDPAELPELADQARRHFEHWGEDWLQGKPISSPHLQKEDARRLQSTLTQLVGDGQAAFKAGELRLALDHLEAASELGPLSAVSLKMIAMARKRLKSPPS